MKKFSKKDLTPEIMKEAMKIESAEELIKYAAGKDIELDADTAKSLIEQLKAVKETELGDDALDSVAGGGACVNMYDDDHPRTNNW